MNDFMKDLTPLGPNDEQLTSLDYGAEDFRVLAKTYGAMCVNQFIRRANELIRMRLSECDTVKLKDGGIGRIVVTKQVRRPRGNA